MLLFPSLEPPSYRLRISPPDLTYPWGITPLQFVLYGAAPANRRATESVPAIYEPEPATTDTLEPKNSVPFRVSSLSYLSPPPFAASCSRKQLGPCIARGNPCILESPLTVTSFGGWDEICKNNATR